MTGQWGDLINANVLLTCGANNAENHPASMRWIDRAREKGATFIVVDPRFTRTAALADIYCPLRPGTDIAFYGGMINYIFENDRLQRDYCVQYTNLSYLINPDYDFDPETGFFSGYDAESGTYDKSTWSYQTDTESDWDTSEKGAYAWTKEEGVPSFNTPKLKTPKKDPTLEDENCVYQIMRRHYSRYDLDTVSNVCGMDRETLEKVYDVYTSTGAKDKAGTILYALGQTQHSTGTGNTRMMSIVQLLLGNIGVPGGQLAALRGEPNVQGCTDMCVAPGDLTGYLKWPTESLDPTINDYLARTTPSDGYWTNTAKFLISYLKSFFGEAATKENDYGFNWLPKVDSAPKRSIQNAFHLIEDGVIKGYMFLGQNPIQSLANSAYLRRVIGNLDWLVSTDMYYTETAEFWKAPDMKDKASEIKTECYYLPVCSMFEKPGTVVNSGRVMQWRYQCSDRAMGESKTDAETLMLIHQKLVELYQEEGGALPEPILNAKWDYAGDDGKADLRKLAWELNGYSTDGATEDFQNGTPKLLDAFSKLKADGSTAAACWIYTGYYGNADAPLDPAQQNVGRRDNTDESGLHIYPNWGFSWPANRRILYNRASCDADGNPWREGLAPVHWDGKEWQNFDVPDFVTSKTDDKGNKVAIEPNNKAFMMRWEQNACLFSNSMNDMPLPEHYEPFESPTENALNGSEHNPAILFAKHESTAQGNVSDYPIVATTYSFTEQWLSGQETHTIPALNEMMPKQFCEISPELAEEKGISNGDLVRVFNERGSVVVNAVVTKRVPVLQVNGSKQYVLGIVHDWGFSNYYTQGDITNDLVPNVGDPNSFIPESKAFLVGLEKA